jgi:hypothetical protein
MTCNLEGVPNNAFKTANRAMFAWLISHQPTVLLYKNKSATSNKSAIRFSQNESAPATSQTNRLQINDL